MEAISVIDEKEILKEIETIYGIEKCKDTIINYAKYLKLKNSNSITIGNPNVLIKCKNEYSQIEILVQSIIKSK